tara:strand:- start:846 stop:1109 length:264 start_codon:yes stop_codon:yes gene_type:complete
MVWVETAKDSVAYKQSKFMRERSEGDISLASEIIINTFFESIRNNIGEDVLTRDEEILLVLDCMKATMQGSEDELAETLSQYIGVRV